MKFLERFQDQSLDIATAQAYKKGIKALLLDVAQKRNVHDEYEIAFYIHENPADMKSPTSGYIKLTEPMLGNDWTIVRQKYTKTNRGTATKNETITFQNGKLAGSLAEDNTPKKLNPKEIDASLASILGELTTYVKNHQE